MKLAFLVLCSCILLAQAPTPSLRGTVTEPSGALVQGALVQILGPGGQRRATSGENGQYLLEGVAPGKYTVRFIAKGFTVQERKNVEIRGAFTLDAQLLIAVDAQVLNVEQKKSPSRCRWAHGVESEVLTEGDEVQGTGSALANRSTSGSLCRSALFVTYSETSVTYSGWQN